MSTQLGFHGLAPTVAIAAAPPRRPVTAAQRALYEDVWGSVSSYGDHSPGVDRVPMFLATTGATSGRVLDAGCGAGKGGLALQVAGFRVTLADLTDVGLTDEARALPFQSTSLWHDLAPLARTAGGFDYVFCVDVLEHIPPEYTMLTIARLLAVADRSLFLAISLRPDEYGAWVGTHLHATVQPFTWWRDRLRDLGTVLEARDALDSGVYLVAPR